MPRVVLLVDALARRYGPWPHEVLDLDAYQIGLACLCLEQHDATRAQACKRIVDHKGMVFPALILGD